MDVTLQPLPAPGLAIFPEFLSNKPTNLVVRGDFFSASFDIVNVDTGEPFILVERDMMSLSHRSHVIHAPTDQELAEIRKEQFTMTWDYHAENAVRGKLFDISTNLSIGAPKWQIDFANTAAGGQPEVLEAKSHSFSFDTTVTWQGQPVATIERKALSMSGQTTLTVAPGLDPFLVVGLTMVMADRRRTRNNR